MSDGIGPQNDSSQFHYDAALHYDALVIIAEALAEGREVNGGEWESVLTLYTAEGLALIILHALHRNGWEVTRA